MGVSEIYLNFLRSPCLGRRGLQRLSLAPIAHFPNSNECKCREPEQRGRARAGARGRVPRLPALSAAAPGCL